MLGEGRTSRVIITGIRNWGSKSGTGLGGGLTIVRCQKSGSLNAGPGPVSHGLGFQALWALGFRHLGGMPEIGGLYLGVRVRPACWSEGIQPPARLWVKVKEAEGGDPSQTGGVGSGVGEGNGCDSFSQAPPLTHTRDPF